MQKGVEPVLSHFQTVDSEFGLEMEGGREEKMLTESISEGGREAWAHNTPHAPSGVMIMGQIELVAHKQVHFIGHYAHHPPIRIPHLHKLHSIVPPCVEKWCMYDSLAH